MYSIRLRINKRVEDFCHGDRTTVGVLMKDGEVRYFYWGGFSLEMNKRVKLKVEAFTAETSWDPRNVAAKMPNWQYLAEDEYLLGSFDGTLVYTMLPFVVVKGRPSPLG